MVADNEQVARFTYNVQAHVRRDKRKKVVTAVLMLGATYGVIIWAIASIIVSVVL